MGDLDKYLDDIVKPKPQKDPLAGYLDQFTPKPQTNSRQQALIQGAKKLGVDPLDYATVISYETAGTFDPWKKGPVTKWGRHRGTIQYGTPQRKKYGVYKGQSFEDQVTGSNVRYLRDAGVKPGADLLTLYKAIIGGNVNVSSNISDKNGTIKSHVRKMVRQHRRNAHKFLKGADLSKFQLPDAPGYDVEPLPDIEYTPAPEQDVKPMSEDAVNKLLYGTQPSELKEPPQVPPPSALVQNLASAPAHAHMTAPKNPVTEAVTPPPALIESFRDVAKSSVQTAPQPDIRQSRKFSPTLGTPIQNHWINGQTSPVTDLGDEANLYHGYRERLALPDSEELRQKWFQGFTPGDEALAQAWSAQRGYVAPETDADAPEPVREIQRVSLDTGRPTDLQGRPVSPPTGMDDFVARTNTFEGPGKGERMFRQTVELAGERLLNRKLTGAEVDVLAAYQKQKMGSFALRDERPVDDDDITSNEYTLTKEFLTEAQAVLEQSGPGIREDAAMAVYKRFATGVPLTNEDFDRWESYYGLTFQDVEDILQADTQAARESRGQSETNKIFVTQRIQELLAGSQPPSREVAELTALSEVGAVPPDAVTQRVLEEGRAEKRFKESAANQSYWDKALGAAGRGVQLLLTTPSSLVREYVIDEFKGKKPPPLTESDEINAALAEVKTNYGSALKREEDFRTNVGGEFDIARQGRHTLRELTRIAGSAVKYGAMLDAVGDKINPLGYVIPKEATPNFRMALNVVEAIASTLTGEKPQFERAQDDLTKSRMYQAGEIIQNVMGDDPYLERESQLGKLNAVATNATVFLVGAYLTGGSPTAITALGSALETPNIYDQLRKKGVSKEQALIWSNALGTLSGASENVGIGGLPRRFARLAAGLSKKSVTELGRVMWREARRQGLREGVEEGSQELLQSAGVEAAVAAIAKERPQDASKIRNFIEGVRETIDALPEEAKKALPEAGMAGFIGLLFGGGGSIAQNIQLRQTAPQETESPPPTSEELDKESVQKAIEDLPAGRVQETPDTIQAQLDAIGQGDRKVVVLPPTPEGKPPKVPELHDLKVIDVADGRKVIYNPKLTTKEEVQKKIDDDTIHEWLGKKRKESAETTEVVAARKEGKEVDTAYTAPEDVEAQSKEFEKQHGKVDIDVTPAVEERKVIADREAQNNAKILADVKKDATQYENVDRFYKEAPAEVLDKITTVLQAELARDLEADGVRFNFNRQGTASDIEHGAETSYPFNAYDISIGGQKLGTVAITPSARYDQVDIKDIEIQKGFRHKGHGTKVIQALMKATGVSAIRPGTYRNEVARKWWEGLRKKYPTWFTQKPHHRLREWTGLEDNPDLQKGVAEPEIWQIPLSEYIERNLEQTRRSAPNGNTRRILTEQHEAAVADAIKQGKVIPSEVAKDHRELISSLTTPQTVTIDNETYEILSKSKSGKTYYLKDSQGKRRRKLAKTVEKALGETKGESLSDFPIEQATQAYSHLYKSPGNVAKLDKQERDDAIKQIRDSVSEHVPELDVATVNNAIRSFNKRFITEKRKVWRAASGAYSAMVAGRSKYNVRKAKRGQSGYDKRVSEFGKWLQSEMASVEDVLGIAEVKRSRAKAEATKKAENVAKGRVKLVGWWHNLKTGDKIDVGGNDKATIKKKNKASIITEGGAKWTFKEITGLDHSWLRKHPKTPKTAIKPLPDALKQTRKQTKKAEASQTLKEGDLVKDTLGRKGKVYADKEGTLYVEQARTKARLPLSDKWKKTPAQVKADKKKAREEKKKGEPKSQNFTQFAIENKYPSDYDILEHGMLGESGSMSKRSKSFQMRQMEKRIRDNTKAHREYEQAILRGDIVDPSKQVTKEKLLKEQDDKQLKKAKSDLQILDNKIAFIESLGPMSHKKNGELKIGYQRSVDDYNAQRDKILAKYPALADTKQIDKDLEGTGKGTLASPSKPTKTTTKKQLLAPNGKPSNLPEHLYKMVRTKDFKKWFGPWDTNPEKASKVIDPVTKEPKIVYHGTAEDFEAFVTSELGKVTEAKSAKQGFFFIDDSETAERYADFASEAPVKRLLDKANQAERRGDWDKYQQFLERAEAQAGEPAAGQSLIPVFLNIRQAEVFDAKGDDFMDIQDEINDYLKESKDFKDDGAIITNLVDDPNGVGRPATHYVVFNPNQIKSIFNKGTFSKTDDRILMSPSDSGYEQHLEVLGSNKNVRMLMSSLSEAGYEKGKTSLTDVIRAYENLLNAVGKPTPIRTGRGNFGQKKAEGFYDVSAEVIRLRSANNIPTAAHEVFHAVQKYVYGQVKGSDLKTLPPAVKTELVGLGKALYGDRKPSGGYGSEGFAEFGRHYLTHDNVKRIAPTTTKWFESEILPKHPKFAKALEKARDLTTEYRKQGAENRAKADTARTGTPRQRVRDAKRALGRIATQYIDEFTPLLKLSKDVERITGKALEAAKDPFKVASFLRGGASSTTHYFVMDGTLDFARNKVGPALEEVVSIVRGQKEDFSNYLKARRAQELLAEGINPGMTQDDADTLVDLYDSPEFQLAAEGVYRWNDDVLNYVKQASPELATTIDKIFAKGWKNYVPLMREFDDVDVKALKRLGRAGGSPLKRIRGSGRRVKDIFPQMIANTEKLIALAHRQRVLDTMVNLAQVEGMGHIIEEVPVDKVPRTTSIETIRKQLEDQGADLSQVDTDELVTFFSPAFTPKGQDPIVPIMKDGKMKWFQVDESLYNTLQGLDLFRFGKVIDLLVGMPTRLFRLGTTGLRPAFALVTNPVRDIQTFLMQSQESNPVKLLGNYVAAVTHALNPKRLKGERSEDLDLFYRLGVNLSQPLGLDTAITRRTASELFQGKTRRVVTHPIEMARELLSVTESVARIAEGRMIAKKIGWDGTSPMTFNDAVQMGLGMKQVTVDFSATGSVGKKVNQAIPFFNANVQGARLFGRNMRDRPARTGLYGFLYLTLPTLYLWWENKDEEWYKDMPATEKHLYWHIEAGDEIIQIPRAFEYGNMFAVLPEAFIDSWYREDPQGVKDALGYVLDTSSPPITPTVLRVAKEQWQNRIDFFDSPIVPKSEEGMRPGEQRSVGTTVLAKTLGDYFPETVSPRRVDHIIRGIGGGAPIDVIKEVERITGLRPAKEMGKSDIFALGKLFRPGGQVGYGSKTIEKFYDEYAKLQRFNRSTDLKLKAKGRRLGEAKKVAQSLKELRDLNITDTNQKSRNARTILMREIAKKFLESAPQPMTRKDLNKRYGAAYQAIFTELYEKANTREKRGLERDIRGKYRRGSEKNRSIYRTTMDHFKIKYPSLLPRRVKRKRR